MPRAKPSKQYIDICAEGPGATVICTGGRHMQVRGSIGAWIAATEFNARGGIKSFAHGRIGEGGLRPGIWYRARNGKLIEA